MKKLKHIALSLVLSLGTTAFLQAQTGSGQNQTMKIKVVVNENGEERIVEKEIVLKDGEDLNSLLQDLEGLEHLDLESLKDFDIDVKVETNGNGVNHPSVMIDKISCGDFPHNGESVTRPFLGVVGYTTNAHNDGNKQVRITKVVENSAASKTGLQSEDLILNADGVDLDTYQQLVEIIHGKKAGDQLKMKVNRNGKTFNLTATLGEKTFKQYSFSNSFEGKDFPHKAHAWLNSTYDVDEETKAKLEKALNPKGVKTFNDVNFQIFPNPSSGSYKYELTIEEAKELDLQVLSLTGETVYSEKLKNKSGKFNGSIDISNAPNGAYILIFKQGEKSLLEKIVKQ